MNEETKVKDRERSSQVTLICRTEIFILRIHFQGPLVTAQVLRDLDGSHITKPPNKPPLLVLLCLVGLGRGVEGERQAVRRGRRQIPKHLFPKTLLIWFGGQMSDLLTLSSF